MINFMADIDNWPAIIGWLYILVIVGRMGWWFISSILFD